MALNLTMPEQDDLKPRITVFGVGGAGGNAVDNMIEKELEGVEFVVANTDAQALQQSKAPVKIQMGLKVTEGLGAGAKATLGLRLLKKALRQIVDPLAGRAYVLYHRRHGRWHRHGRGTDHWASGPRAWRFDCRGCDQTFQFEGSKRMRQAEEGVDSLQRLSTR